MDGIWPLEPWLLGASVLEVIYDWFKACQAATQFIASYAGVYDV